MSLIESYYFKYFITGLLLSLITFIFLLSTPFTVLSFLPIVMLIGIANYKQRLLVHEYEVNFTAFLDDLRDLLQGGMSVVQAMTIVSRNDYGKLKFLVGKVAAQLKLGVSFEDAMINVFGKIKSNIIRKSVMVISESHKQGGSLLKVFDVTSRYLTEIERLKQKRRSVTFSALFSSYLMFFIFLGIIITIQLFFLPIVNTSTFFEADLMNSLDFQNSFL
ncbi:MAG: type II secretion system F family protein, partial [archaeon]